MTPLLLTKTQAAKRLNVSYDVLHRLVLRGELATVAVGGDERIPDDELVEWVRLNKRVCRYDEGRGEQASGKSTSGTSVSGAETGAGAKRKRSRKKGVFAPNLDWDGATWLPSATLSTDTGASTAVESVAEHRRRLISRAGSPLLGPTPD